MFVQAHTSVHISYWLSWSPSNVKLMPLGYSDWCLKCRFNVEKFMSCYSLNMAFACFVTKYDYRFDLFPSTLLTGGAWSHAWLWHSAPAHLHACTFLLTWTLTLHSGLLTVALRTLAQCCALHSIHPGLLWPFSGEDPCPVLFCPVPKGCVVHDRAVGRKA